MKASGRREGGTGCRRDMYRSEYMLKGLSVYLTKELCIQVVCRSLYSLRSPTKSVARIALCTNSGIYCVLVP